MAGAAVTESYLMHGMVVRSTLALPERVVESDRPPDCDVTMGPERPTRVDDDPLLALRLGERTLYQAVAVPNGWELAVPGYATFRVDSSSIGVLPDPCCPDRSFLQLLLSGNAISFWLMMRGEVCLHAGAFEADDRWYAVSGPSGAGKSTLVTLACASGHRLVADDILRVETDSAAAIGHRGSPEIRVRDLGRIVDAPTWPVRITPDDRRAVMPPASARTRSPLRALLLPSLDRSRADVAAEFVQGPESVVALSACLRLSGWSDHTIVDRLFGQLVALSEVLPVIRVKVPWSNRLSARLIDELLDAVERMAI
jgi:hypothetical protein